MSEPFSIGAPAKTNLNLRVLGKREDGFHEISTRMVALTLEDQLTLEWTDDDRVFFTCSDESLPIGEENLVLKAVRALEKHLDKSFSLKIHLEKEIPSGAGLGGGSSDAASVLLALNEMGQFQIGVDELAAIGATIGSDIPFFVYQSPCDCTGRGEVVEPVRDDPPASIPLVLLKPGFGISAAWAYQNYADSSRIEGFSYIPQICPWGEMVNDLERPVFQKFPLLGVMKNWLLEQEEVHAAMMSGSGSTMLAALSAGADGRRLIEKAKAEFGEPTWAFCGFTV